MFKKFNHNERKFGEVNLFMHLAFKECDRECGGYWEPKSVHRSCLQFRHVTVFTRKK